MSRLLLTRLAACAAVLAGGMAAEAPSAHAGSYHVRSCFADGIATIWNRYRSDGFADAYVECPQGVSGSRGLIARNVLTSSPAPGFSHAKLFVNAPPGTYIDEITFDASIGTDRGWVAGLFDRQNNQWVWCGTTPCNTFGYWFSFQVGGLATSSLESLVWCAAAECRSDGMEAGSIALRNVTLRLQDVWSPSVSIVGGSLAGGGWKRGVQTVEVAGSDNTGVAALRVLVDGSAPATRETSSCDDHLLVPCPAFGDSGDTFPVDLADFSDGARVLAVQAVDSAGNVTPSAVTVLVDNTAPNPVEDLARRAAASGSGQTRFVLRWKNPADDGNAPIAGAVDPDLPRRRCPRLSGAGRRSKSLDRAFP